MVKESVGSTVDRELVSFVHHHLISFLDNFWPFIVFSVVRSCYLICQNSYTSVQIVHTLFLKFFDKPFSYFDLEFEVSEK